MPIMPAVARLRNSRAAPPSEVKIAAPLPYSLRVDELERLVERRRAHHHEQRPEDLVAVDAHLRRSRGRARVGPTKKPSSWPSTFSPRPSSSTSAPSSAPRSTYDGRRAAGRRAVMTGPISLWGRRRGRRSSRGALDDRGGEPLGRLVAHGDDRGDRHAALAGAAERGRGDRVGGDVEVRVGQHDRVVLRAAERLRALAVRGRRLVDVLRDGRRPDERDGVDLGVGQQRVDRDLVALDRR